MLRSVKLVQYKGIVFWTTIFLGYDSFVLLSVILVRYNSCAVGLYTDAMLKFCV